MSARAKVRGTTLLEVIVAVGILGFGFAALLGYTAAVAERLRAADELADAALCESIRAFLQSQPLDTVAGWLDQPNRLRADRLGRMVAPTEDPLWSGPERPFYSISLRRHGEESPVSEDATAVHIVFDVQVSGLGT